MKTLEIPLALLFYIKHLALDSKALYAMASSEPTNIHLNKPKLVIHTDKSILGLSKTGEVLITEIKVIRKNNEIAMQILSNIENGQPIASLMTNGCLLKVTNGIISIKFSVQRVIKHPNKLPVRYLIQYET